MQESFQRPSNPEALAPGSKDEAAENLMVDPADTAVAIRATVALGMVGGDINVQRDIRWPRLNLVHGVGTLAASFSPASWVLDKTDLIAERNVPIEIVVMSAFKYWKEWLSNEDAGNGIMPRRFNVDAEVRAAGGTTQWGPNGEKPTFSPAMDLKLLIKKPAGVESSAFGFVLDGSEYAAAIWTVDKTSYGRIGPEILKAAALKLKVTGLLAGKWSLVAKVESRGNKTVTVPAIKLLGLNTPVFMDAVKALMSEPVDDAQTAPV